MKTSDEHKIAQARKGLLIVAIILGIMMYLAVKASK